MDYSTEPGSLSQIAVSKGPEDPFHLLCVYNTCPPLELGAFFSAAD